MLAPLSCSERVPEMQEPPGRTMEEHAPPAASVADIVRAVGREVADAGQRACDLQDALSGFAQALGQQEQAIEACQALDFLTQQLQGVAAFLDALAPTLPACCAGDAAAVAQAITMSGLARRLGHPHDASHVSREEDVGAFEFF